MIVAWQRGSSSREENSSMVRNAIVKPVVSRELTVLPSPRLGVLTSHQKRGVRCKRTYKDLYQLASTAIRIRSSSSASIQRRACAFEGQGRPAQRQTSLTLMDLKGAGHDMPAVIKTDSGSEFYNTQANTPWAGRPHSAYLCTAPYPTCSHTGKQLDVERHGGEQHRSCMKVPTRTCTMPG